MTQVTAIDLEGVAQSQLVQTPTQDSGAHLWRQMSKCAARMACGLRRWAQRRTDQVLLPPDVSGRQFRHDILRIEARRLL
jgi:hypothetical protein